MLAHVCLPQEGACWKRLACRLVAALFVVISGSRSVFSAIPDTASPFVMASSAEVLSIECPSTALKVEFVRASGQFHITGPGAPVLSTATLRVRSNGKLLTSPEGVSLQKASVHLNTDSLGKYAEILAEWTLRDIAATPVLTSVRLYAATPGVIFGQGYPKGLSATASRDFGDVGCAFPVFDAPANYPETLRWLSYTYQDWPMPIRGSGWPVRLSRRRWPAGGDDDAIRVPLVLWTGEGACQVLSPLDHGLTQIAALGRPASTPATTLTTEAIDEAPAPVALNPVEPPMTPQLSSTSKTPDSPGPNNSVAAVNPGQAANSAGNFAESKADPASPNASPKADPASAIAASKADPSAQGAAPTPPATGGVSANPPAADNGKTHPPAADNGKTPPPAADNGKTPPPPPDPPFSAAGSAATTNPRVDAVDGVTGAGITTAALRTNRVFLPSLLVGPEGKLQEIPPGTGFHSVLLFGREGVNQAIRDWGALLQRYNHKDARPAPEDFTARELGYWTDNGAAYYYHTEGNASYQATLAAIRAYHLENQIPVRYYQLDSWWYSKGADGGTLLWTPNPRTLPGGSAGLLHALGAPVALHNRYWSSQSPYSAGGEFSSSAGPAVPTNQTFYDSLFKAAKEWDCRLYEQDWLATQFRKVDTLQTHEGAAAAWMHAMDSAAAKFDMPVQFCMPSMGFYLASTGMPNVTQIRTSEDFSRDTWENVRRRWMEFCQLSLVASAVGLEPSKDVFRTTQNGSVHGAAWEESEALLAILSRGPVGIGDPFGYTDMEMVHHLCLEDGTLAQPDAPAIPVEASVTGAADAAALPLMMEAGTTVNGYDWRYLLTLSLGDTRTFGVGRSVVAGGPFSLIPAAPTTALASPVHGRYVCYDYLHDSVLGVAGPGGPVDLDSGRPLSRFPLKSGEDFTYSVLAPIGVDGTALIGDLTKYVTGSSVRFAAVHPGAGGFQMLLQGPADSEVRLAFYNPACRLTLEVGGQTVAPDVERTITVPRAAPGGKKSGGAESSGQPGLALSPQHPDGLWHFTFHLPVSAKPGPVQVTLRSSTLLASQAPTLPAGH